MTDFPTEADIVREIANRLSKMHDGEDDVFEVNAVTPHDTDGYCTVEAIVEVGHHDAYDLTFDLTVGDLTYEPNHDNLNAGWED